MKVVLCGVGETHYFSLLLNRMVSDFSCNIYNVVPSKGAGHFGKGVSGFSGKRLFASVELRDVNFLRSNRLFLGLMPKLVGIRPDVLIVSEEYLYAIVLNPLMMLLLKVLGVKVFLKSIPFRLPDAETYKQSSPWPIGNIKLFLRSFIYRILDGHLVYINKGKEIYGSYGVDPSKVFVTYNSPDTDHLLKIYEKLCIGLTKSAGEPFRIVHVGRLIEWKRVDLLIEAAEEVRKLGSNIELVIIGDGPERVKLEEFSRTFKELSVKFLGGIHDYSLLGKELINSDLYVLAGIGGLSINDAMCFGLPVICSECDGTEEELVKDGQNGYIFKKDSVSDLVDKIRLVVENPAKKEAMGKASLEIIKNKININTVLSAYFKAFRS